MIQNIKNGVVKRIFWDCVAKGGEEDEENEEEVENEEAAENVQESDNANLTESEEEKSVQMPSSKIGQFIKKSVLPKLRGVVIENNNSRMEKKPRSHDITQGEN